MPAKEDVLDLIAELELQADDIFEGAMQQLDSRGTLRGSAACVPRETANSSVPVASLQATAKTATAKPTTAPASKRATSAAAKTTTARGARGGSRASTRNANNKNELDVTITSAAANNVQPSIMSSFASQSSRQSSRLAPVRQKVPTQYISDSD